MPGWFPVYQCEGSDKESQPQMDDFTTTIANRFDSYLNNNYSPIEIKPINPIVTIDNRNDTKTVDVLLEECNDLIDTRYVPWFAKRFYWFEKDSVLKAASVARADGKNPQKNFTHFVKTIKLEKV